MLNNSKQYDVVIVGGGIVGLAVAMTLSDRFRDYRFLVLEKESAIAKHQTGHNSGVIHSGIYYKPGSLKARLCVDGARRLIQFAEWQKIPFELCGKLIVATREEEIMQLMSLWKRGIANDVQGLQLMGAEEIKNLEPHIQAVQGIHSPTTGIIDYQIVAQKLAECFVANGGDVLLNAQLRSIRSMPNSLILETSHGEIFTHHLINCAGLQSDRVAHLMGVHPKVQIIPFLGEYYDIAEDRKHLIHNLVYPVPDPLFPFLGVHLTRTVHGTLESGPNALLAFSREGYHRMKINPRDVFSMIAFEGFWKMMGKYWRKGLLEIFQASNKRVFLHQIQKLLPELELNDLKPGLVGIRAQCVDAQGNLVDDFHIEKGPHSIHVLNVPSPAATACLSIADYVVSLAAETFELKGEKVGRALHE